MSYGTAPLDPSRAPVPYVQQLRYDEATAFEPAADDYLNDRDLLNDLIEKTETAEDASRKMRENAERNIDYYDNKQMTEKEFAKMVRRRQKPITLNLIRGKVDWYRGLERGARTKPVCLPRTGKHEMDANSVSDALKYVMDDQHYMRLRGRVWDDVLKAGWGGLETIALPAKRPAPGQPRMVVTIRRCKWDRMLWDPFSEEYDFSDCSFRGLVIWMDKDAARRQWGERANDIFEDTLKSVAPGSTYDDKPKIKGWVQFGKRKRVRIVQMYYRDPRSGEWHFCEFTRGGILNGGPSPWLNEDGERVCPYQWQSAYVDRDCQRYGVIQDMIDPQDEVNVRRSRALHLFSVRQTFGSAGSDGKAAERNRQELAKADGHVIMPSGQEWGKHFGVIPTNDLAAGQFQLGEQAHAVFSEIGPNAAAMGIGSSQQSGRAIQARQQGGSITVSPLTAALRDMDIEVYTQAWLLIRQFWDAETWVRVTDDEKNIRWVVFNAPVQNMLGGVMMDPNTGQAMIDPRTDVARLDVDITIDDAPDAATMIQEQWEQLVQLKSFDQGNEIPFKAIVKAAPNLRLKDEILADINKREEQGPPPQAQAAMKLEMDQKAADVQKTQAEAAKIMREAQLGPEAVPQPPGPDPTVEHLQKLKFREDEHTQSLIFDAQKHRQQLAMRAQEANVNRALKARETQATRSPVTVDNETGDVVDGPDPLLEQVSAMMAQQAQAMTMIAQAVAQMAAASSAPKRVQFDETGMPVGIVTMDEGTAP